jgi:predicted nucleic acid-binding protein
MTALVDTDVLIDILRGTVAAQSWLASTPMTTFAIPSVVAMELVMGCRNQVELRRRAQLHPQDGRIRLYWRTA